MKVKVHPIKYFWIFRALFYKFFCGKVGNITYIGKPTFIEGCKNIFIGNRVRIFPGLRAQTLDGGKITINNNVAIEQNVQITSGGGNLLIDKNCVIAANSFITNIDHEYYDTEISALEQPMIYNETTIGEGCFIGYGAAIQAGTKLGKHCIVGTNAVVRGEFPDYCVIVGVPGKVIKKYDIEKRQWVKNC